MHKVLVSALFLFSFLIKSNNELVLNSPSLTLSESDQSSLESASREHYNLTRRLRENLRKPRNSREASEDIKVEFDGLVKNIFEVVALKRKLEANK